jgi:small ligand-binding sensory domain FIST
VIQAGVGHSTSLDLGTAAREASSNALERLGRSKADLLLCFATPEFSFHYRHLHRTLSEYTGTSQIVGCSAMAIITGEGEFEGSPGLAVMALATDGLKVLPFLSEDGSRLASRLAGALGPSDESPRDNHLLLLFTDVFKVQAPDLLETLHKELGHIPTVGAAASGHPEDSRTVQWTGNREVNHGMSGVLFSGPIVHRTTVSQGCEPIGEPYLITRSEGKVIMEIGNRPAYEMLQRALSIFPPEEEERVSKGVFAGLLIDEHKYPPSRGDYLIRNIEMVDPYSGTITLVQEAHPGQTIQFHVRNPTTAREELLTGVEQLGRETSPYVPLFALYFESVGRGARLHRKPDHDVNIIKKGLGNIPLIGFLSNAEFAPREERNLAHTYSSVLTLVCRQGPD